MYKRILALSLLTFSFPANRIFADTNSKTTEKIEKRDTKDFFDEFLDDNISYEAQPQVYISFYPRLGFNFIYAEEKDREDFSFWRSRSTGATLAINMPIKSHNFFYSVAFDFSHRGLQWKNFKNFYSQSLWFGCNEDKKINEIFQNAFSEDVKCSRLNFWVLDVMFQLGYKSNILDHRKGFFAKGILGVGFQFRESVDNEKTNFTIETRTNDNIPLRNIKFLWGVEMGYWRIGLNLIGDFNSLFKKKEENSNEIELDVSRQIIPLSLSIFFDIF